MGSLSRRGLFGLASAAVLARFVPAAPPALTLSVGDVVTFAGSHREFTVKAVGRSLINLTPHIYPGERRG